MTEKSGTVKAPERQGSKGPKVAIYARVSTDGQYTSRQVSELSDFADRMGFEVVGVFQETASGRNDARPERRKILALAQRRDIDAILVTEILRWGRSTPDLLSTLDELEGRGVSLKALNGFDVDFKTANGRMMATLLAGISQFEADLLKERVRSGLARAKQKGKVLGRKKGDAPVVRKYSRKVRELAKTGRSQRSIATEIGIDRKTVKRILSE
ncbi:Site-specific DNA recombinase [Palleronia marisminoris]|uniref:recombinase family protein n=1 Tax=Palleronia marisminoris TaxID=315423 RepID=UPI0008E5CC40|nr:recombinase family protein [Palleronia marisminoris]SFH28521.1 Site-specific DNA recombinase [Palleronia marisminoris]